MAVVLPPSGMVKVALAGGAKRARKAITDTRTTFDDGSTPITWGRSLESKRAAEAQRGWTPAAPEIRELLAATLPLNAEVTLILVGPPDRDGSVGGWQTLERPYLPDAAWFKSTPGGTISLPCLLDVDELPGASLEDRLDLLYAMGTPLDEGEDPPGLRLYGDVPTARAQTWKLDNISLGARLFRPDAPRLLRRQELTLDLSDLEEITGVEKVRVKRTRGRGGKRRRRTIRVRNGDTLRAIAVRELGSSGAYEQIRKANKKLKRTDPDAPLRVGMEIVLQ